MSIEKISVALPSEMVVQLRHAVDRGEYASSSEIVREALRDWNSKRKLQQQGIKELRKLWQQAIDSGNSTVPVEAVLTPLEKKYKALAKTAAAAK
jgi:antitoxin ParD1/3/4